MVMFDEIPVDMYKPNCENPVLLVNRAALNYYELGNPVYGDVATFLYGKLVKNISQGVLLDYARKNEDKIENNYVLMPNGHKEPVFLYAPCGHCILCRENKRNDLVFRSIMESACYNCPPVFFTLTYDEEHLPCVEVDTCDYELVNNKLVETPKHIKHKNLGRGELCYKDVQDFFKRLRRKWDRQGIKHNIRYLVSGEYGSKTGRAHYHVILWNNPYGADENNPVFFKQLENDIFTAWGKCQRAGFDFGQCRGGASSYAAKYVSKPCKMHGHIVKPFIHCSNGHGGLGSPLLKKLKKYLQANPHLREVSFRGYNGDLVECGFSSYIVSQVWPSPTRLVPTKVKSLYKQFCDTLAVAQSLNLLSFNECRDYADFANPCPDVLPNQYKPIKPVIICSTAKEYYYKPFIFSLLKSLLNNIQEVFFNFDFSYIMEYMNYRREQPATTCPSNTASQVLRIHNRLATMTDKETF